MNATSSPRPIVIPLALLLRRDGHPDQEIETVVFRHDLEQLLEAPCCEVIAVKGTVTVEWSMDNPPDGKTLALNCADGMVVVRVTNADIATAHLLGAIYFAGGTQQGITIAPAAPAESTGIDTSGSTSTEDATDSDDSLPPEMGEGPRRHYKHRPHTGPLPEIGEMPEKICDALPHLVARLRARSPDGFAFAEEDRKLFPIGGKMGVEDITSLRRAATRLATRMQDRRLGECRITTFVGKHTDRAQVTDWFQKTVQMNEEDKRTNLSLKSLSTLFGLLVVAGHARYDHNI